MTAAEWAAMGAAGLAGLTVSLVWGSFAGWLGPRIGLVDRPSESDLKVHRVAAVPLGGVGIAIAVAIAAVFDAGLPFAVFFGAGLVFLVGLIDDRFHLPPVLRLALEAVAGGMAGFALFPHPVLGVLAAASLVVAVNALNLFDGLDGLAGSVSLVAVSGLLVMRSLISETGVVEAALIGALAGFLVRNRHPARLFLGDNGAYLLGFLIAADALRVGAEIGGWASGVAAAGILGVILADLVVTILRRLRSGTELFVGDRDHLYDRINRRVGVTRTIAYLAAVQIGINAVVVAAVASFGSILALLVSAGAVATVAAFLALAARVDRITRP